jgi:HD domain
VSALERAAEAWIAGYFNARHLRRTRDWALELDASASEALRVAALTHDIERREPGGPRLDPRHQSWDDAEYLRAHSERSAEIVDRWLAERAAAQELRADVAELIRRHETGGPGEADVLQAADSLSFLEVNASRAVAWVEEGRCTPAQARAKLDWMLERIRVPAARELADPLHRRATARIR